MPTTLSFTRGGLHRQWQHRMELGIERIADLMRSNRLWLNPERTDILGCATRRQCIHLDTGELSVCGALIRPSTSVRYLGVLLGPDLPMRRHVAWTVICCFHQPCLIRSCIKSLPLGAAKAAVAAFVTSRVDRCNSLLARLVASWMDSSRCSMLQRGSSATGGSMTTSRDDRTKWWQTKWYRQNGLDKWYTDKMVLDKMVYGQNGIGQNGTDKMVWTKWYNFIFCVPFNSVEFNIYLVTKSHK